MPIYEYVCESCEARIEVKQKLSDPPLTTCERCGKGLTKVISSPAIMFKGSGWYITDYSDKMKAPKEGEGASAQTGEKKPDTKATAGTSETSTSPTPATSGSPPSSSGSAGSGGDKPAAPPKS